MSGLDLQITVFANAFRDINSLAPILLATQQQQRRCRVVLYFENLKHNEDTFFADAAQDILALPALAHHDVVVCRTTDRVRDVLAESDIVISTSTSVFLLLAHELLPKQLFWRRRRPFVVALDYFAERTAAVSRQADLLVVGTEFWKHDYRPRAVQYGLPFWDLFVDEGMLADASHQAVPRLPTDKRLVLLPEIYLSQDSWHRDCAAYIRRHADGDTCFVLKLRLKNQGVVDQNRAMITELENEAHIVSVFSPFWFTTVHLLQVCDEIVFTSNASMMVLDCMAAGRPITRAYDQATYGTWKSWVDADCAEACDRYAADPDAARQFFIGTPGGYASALLRLLADSELSTQRGKVTQRLADDARNFLRR